MPGSPQTRAQALAMLREQALGCTRCPKLAAARTQVVFGSGPASAELMFVGEAPGAAEDREDVPIAGAAGALLEELLAGLGLRLQDVAVLNVLKCRPPDNRNPLAGEIENCREYLLGQVELVAPVVVCSLGTFATRVLRGKPAGITAVRGQDEVVVIGTRAVRLLPLLHPAAALYTPAGIERLRADIARIPALLALGAPEQPEPAAGPEAGVVGDADAGRATSAVASGVGAAPVRRPEPEAEPAEPEEPATPPAEQLNLF